MTVSQEVYTEVYLENRKLRKICDNLQRDVTALKEMLAKAKNQVRALEAKVHRQRGGAVVSPHAEADALFGG